MCTTVCAQADLQATVWPSYLKGLCCSRQRAKKQLQVAYIDTEGTFRAEKIRAIAARFDLDADAVLDNVTSSPLLILQCPCLV